MTKCQQYYPTDPSRSVDFIRAERTDGEEYEPDEPTAKKVEFTCAKEPEVENTKAGLAPKDDKSSG